MNIAVIGSGISGLSVASLLSQKYSVTLYERDSSIGGHSRTVDVSVKGDSVAVDTGFIVYNERNYPLLTKLFAHLGVQTAPSNMSFAASIDAGWLEYGTATPRAILAQPLNLLRPKYYGMIWDVRRFFSEAPAYAEASPSVTLGEWLDKQNYGEWFCKYFLLPMGGAIWSCPLSSMREFPLRTFVQFFKNHGLLSFNDQPKWRTVRGGSREYVKLLHQSFLGKTVNRAVTRVARKDDCMEVSLCEPSETQRYDHVVFACHADEALALIDRPTSQEVSVLSNFRFQENKAVLHGDPSLMPVRRNAWASWVYLLEARNDARPRVSLSYWMNSLQPLATNSPLILTLNPHHVATSAEKYDSHVFRHPILNFMAIDAQDRIPTIQGVARAWFVGAYQRYGFHEDGLWSAVRVAQGLGVTPSWS